MPGFLASRLDKLEIVVREVSYAKVDASALYVNLWFQSAFLNAGTWNMSAILQDGLTLRTTIPPHGESRMAVLDGNQGRVVQLLRLRTAGNTQGGLCGGPVEQTNLSDPKRKDRHCNNISSWGSVAALASNWAMLRAPEVNFLGK